MVDGRLDIGCVGDYTLGKDITITIVKYKKVLNVTKQSGMKIETIYICSETHVTYMGHTEGIGNTEDTRSCKVTWVIAFVFMSL